MLKYLSFFTRVATFVVFVIHCLNVLVDQPSSPARWTWPVENMQMSLRQLSSRCFQLEQPAAWLTWSRSLWTRLKSDFRWGSSGEQTILSTQTQPLRGLLLLRSFMLLLRYNRKVCMTSWEETPLKTKHFTPYRLHRPQQSSACWLHFCAGCDLPSKGICKHI